MPAYVLIRETKKERRAPLRVCIAAVAGLGLGGALLGGAAYGPSLAGGLLRFVPFLAPILESGHEPRRDRGFRPRHSDQRRMRAATTTSKAALTASRSNS